MDPEPTDPDMLLLSLNLSDSEPDEAAVPATAAGTSPSAAASLTTEHQPTRAERTALSEEAFQALKRTYRPKVENGDLYKSIPLPHRNNNSNNQSSSPPPTAHTPLTKPEAQALLHAAEELYFFKRYDTAVEFLRGVLGEEAEGADPADEPGDKPGEREGEIGADGHDDGGDGHDGVTGDDRGDGDESAAQNDSSNRSQSQETGIDTGSAKQKKDRNARIDAETRRLLRYYLQRCLVRVREGSAGQGREVSCH